MNNATLILYAKAANNIPLDEELHTFAILNKSIKKKKDTEDEEENDDGYFYTKVAAFFTKNQVQLLDGKE